MIQFSNEMFPWPLEAHCSHWSQPYKGASRSQQADLVGERNRAMAFPPSSDDSHPDPLDVLSSSFGRLLSLPSAVGPPTEGRRQTPPGGTRESGCVRSVLGTFSMAVSSLRAQEDPSAIPRQGEPEPDVGTWRFSGERSLAIQI